MLDRPPAIVMGTREPPEGWQLGCTVVLKEWTLEEAQVRQKALIDVMRDAACDAGLDTPYGRFDTDEKRSRPNINGAASAAMAAASIGAPFSVTWTLADNSAVALDGPQMIEVGLLVVAFVDAQFARGRELKSTIDTAETVEAVQAVTW